MDDDLGDKSSRNSISANMARFDRSTFMQATLYGIYYDLNLWANFTYFLEDPVNGDEFEQVDERFVHGGNVSHAIMEQELLQKPTRHTFGAQSRIDNIQDVALYNTAGRTRLSIVRQDEVGKMALGLSYENETQWFDHLKTVFGVRVD